MKKQLLGAIIMGLLSSSAYALDAKVNGFGTIGYGVLDTSKTQYNYGIGGNGNQNYLTDTLVGAQMDANITQKLSLTGQVLVAQSLDKRTQMDARVEWLFLGYRLDDQTRVRLGRLRLPAYMLSEKLEVGYAYPWVRPPVEMYGQLPANNIDGIDLTYRTEIGDTEIMLQPFFGFSKFNVYNVDKLEPEKNFEGQANDVMGLNVLVSPSDDLKFRAGYFSGDILSSGNPNNTVTIKHPIYGPLTLNAIDLAHGSGTGLKPNDLSKSINFNGTFTSFGMQYKFNDTTLIAEYGKRSMVASIYEDSNGGYISLAHKFGKITPFVYYAAANGEAEKDKVGGQLKYDQRTWAAGLNYDVDAKSKVKLQVENTYFGENRSAPRSYSVSLKDQEVNMISVTYDFLF